MHLLLILLALTTTLSAQPPGIPTAADSAKNTRIKWVNEPKPGQLPEGVTHRTFRSAAFGRDVGYCIYLPPGYATDAARRYPVIYNLHGAGGNELHSFSSAKALHDGIVAGRWPAMILVLPNGGSHTFYKNSADGKLPAETLIIRELIPHVDATYRTVASRTGRAIEGFSMGGRGATRLAMKYPELFCSLHNQAGNVMHLLDLYDPKKPDAYPNSYLGPDRERYEENDVYSLIKKNAAAIKSGVRILITCGTRPSAVGPKTAGHRNKKGRGHPTRSRGSAVYPRTSAPARALPRLPRGPHSAPCPTLPFSSRRYSILAPPLPSPSPVRWPV